MGTFAQDDSELQTSILYTTHCNLFTLFLSEHDSISSNPTFLSISTMWTYLKFFFFFFLNSDRWLVVGHTGAVLLKVNLFFKRVAAENPRGSQASLHILLRCEKLYSYWATTIEHKLPNTSGTLTNTHCFIKLNDGISTCKTVICSIISILLNLHSKNNKDKGNRNNWFSLIFHSNAIKTMCSCNHSSILKNHPTDTHLTTSLTVP